MELDEQPGGSLMWCNEFTSKLGFSISERFAGATSGIGKESARVLAKRGAHVILAVRNVKLGEEVCAEIRKETPAARLDVMLLDLNSLTSVREFAASFKSRNLPLNILL